MLVPNMYGQVWACLKSFNFYKDACTLFKGFYNVNKIDAHTCDMYGHF